MGGGAHTGHPGGNQQIGRLWVTPGNKIPDSSLRTFKKKKSKQEPYLKLGSSLTAIRAQECH